MRLFLAHIFFFIFPLLWGQYSYNYRLFTIEDGLFNNGCYKLFQDSKGFLWIANGKGISRYSGKKFLTFYESHFKGRWQIENFIESPMGKVFACSRYFIFDPIGNSFQYSDTLQNVPRKASVDKNLYMIYDELVFDSVRTGHSTFLPFSKWADTIAYKYEGKTAFALPRDGIKYHHYSVLRDQQNNVYVRIWNQSAEIYHYYLFNRGKLVPVFKSKISGRRIAKDKKGNLILISGGQRCKLDYFDPAGKALTSYQLEIVAFEFECAVDSANNLWIATEKGLACINEHSFVEYTDPDRNIDYQMVETYDANGNPYLAKVENKINYGSLSINKNGTVVNGDRLFYREKFYDLLEFEYMKHITPAETKNIKQKIILQIMCDREDNIWMATTEGLLRLTPVPFRKPQDYPSKTQLEYKLKFTDCNNRKFYARENSLDRKIDLKIIQDTSCVYRKTITKTPFSNVRSSVKDLFQFLSCGNTTALLYNDAQYKYTLEFYTDRFIKSYQFNSAPKIFLQAKDTLVFLTVNGDLIKINSSYRKEKKMDNFWLKKLVPGDFGGDSPFGTENSSCQINEKYSRFIDKDLTLVKLNPDLSPDTFSFGNLKLNTRYAMRLKSRIDIPGFELMTIDSAGIIYLLSDSEHRQFSLDSGAAAWARENATNNNKFSLRVLRDLLVAQNTTEPGSSALFKFDINNLKLTFIRNLEEKEYFPSWNDNYFHVHNDYLIINSSMSRELAVYDYKNLLDNGLKFPVRVKMPSFEYEMKIGDRNYFKNCLDSSFFNKQAPAINYMDVAYLENGVLNIIEDFSRKIALPANFINVHFSYSAISLSEGDYTKVKYNLLGLDSTWQDINSDNIKFSSLPPGSYTLQIKACNNHNYWSEPKQLAFSVDYPWYRTWTAYTGYLVIGFGSVFGFIRVRTRQLENEKKKLEQIVIDRTTELREQKHLIEEKNKEITDSINYAQKIQSTLMASKTLLDNYLVDKINGRDYFIFYQPKDIVSGDYYWAFNPTDKKDEFILITADCTGHGVPGAFMSLLCISYLNEIVKEQKITQPHLIFNQVRDKIVNNFRAHENPERKDGMDAVLCKFNFKNNSLDYAAGNNPVVVVEPNDKGTYELKELDYDKMPVGVSHNSEYPPFKHFNYQLRKGSIVYTFTDGFADQFGGPKGKKFMYRKLRDLILSNAHLSMEEQKDQLKKAINDWMGENEQVDDICVIGILI